MKDWEIIADNLSKADGVGAVSQPLILRGEPSGLLTHTATTESVSLHQNFRNSEDWKNSSKLAGFRQWGFAATCPDDRGARRRRGPPTLNSARRPLTSPSRGRLVEWSDQRPGIERLHFRPRRLCRRCACDASYESVGNAGSIDVTTTDIPLRTDSVKRCKGGPGIIESEEAVWRDKEKSMSRA